jgi:hypothetical protein
VASSGKFKVGFMIYNFWCELYKWSFAFHDLFSFIIQTENHLVAAK